MTSSNTYLYFNGNCEEALNLYVKVLGARIGFMMKTKDAPKSMECDADMGEGVMHATLMIGETKVLVSDVPPSYYAKPQGFNINVNVTEPAEAERIYASLSEGGEQTMPLQETFWAKRFGTCIDRFGIPWMVNCEKPM